MKNNLKSLHVVALPVAVLAMSGCAGGFYDTAFSRLDYGGAQRPASIQVSDPQLYKRESLINERRDEAAYLAELLKASKTVEFAPELLRDLEVVKSLSAQLGLSFDAGARQQYNQAAQLSDLEQQIAATKLQMQVVQLRRDLDLLQGSLAAQTAPSGAAGTPAAGTTPPKVTPPGLGDAKEIALRLEALVKSLTERLDKPSTPPRASTASVSPRELFQDRQAYRRDIQSAINANALDGLHDLDANSLFRMQFHAIVLPGEADKELGVLQMQVKRPEFVVEGGDPKKMRENWQVLESFYLEWLAHATLRLNERDEDSDTIRPDPAMQVLGAEERVFSIATLTVPKKAQTPGAKRECESHIYFDFKPQQGDCYVFRVALPPSVSDDVDRVGELDKYKSEQEAMVRKEVPRGAGKKEPPIAKLIQFGTTTANRMKSQTEELKKTVRELPSKRSREYCERQLADNGPFFVGRALASTVKHVQRGFSLATAQTRLSSSDAILGFMVDAIFFVRIAAEFESAYLELQNKCEAVLPEAEASRIVPVEFINALFERNANTVAGQTTLTAKGRVSAYAVSPIALAQRVSTAARAADAIQIAASLAAALPAQGLGLNTGLGYMRSVTGKVDALERVPLVIGYSSSNMNPDANGKVETDTARFGWLLGPKVVLDPEKKALALEHNLAPYDLTVDISMPGWWPRVDIETEAAWAPNWRGSDRNAVIAQPPTQSSGGATAIQEIPGSKRIIPVPMRHSKGDLDGLTLLLINSRGGVHVQIASISSVTPRVIPDCSGMITLVVRGSNIWRAQSAYLLGQPGEDITVLPDMAGITVKFDISKLPPASGKASLLVATPDGPASHTIQIKADGQDGKKCVTPSPKS